MAWLYGQGLIDYSARVTEYWPAFGGNGKQDLTVADVMRHEGGWPRSRSVLTRLTYF